MSSSSSIGNNDDDNDAEDVDDDSAADDELKEAINFAKTWDPLDPEGIVATKGWMFPGFLAFVCFGPTSQYFSLTLQQGGFQKHQAVGRRQLRKEQKERDAVTREKGGMTRGVSKDQQMRDEQRAERVVVQSEAMAHMRDDRLLRERELYFFTVSKKFDMTQKILDTKIRFLEKCNDPSRSERLSDEIDGHLVEIEELRREMTTLGTPSEAAAGGAIGTGGEGGSNV